MMVNQIKDNSSPWQSDVPQQMPWMSSYQPTSCNLQFGQHTVTDPNTTAALPTSVDHNYLSTQQQYPFIASFHSATTLTQPMTSCPTSILANPMCPANYNITSNNVTTTTQSSAYYSNMGRPLNQANPVKPLNPCSTESSKQVQFSPTFAGFNPQNPLTHMPAPLLFSGKYHKRRSVEMEDDQIKADEPPTKQILSEQKLFKQFGSLQLDGCLQGVIPDIGSDSDDSDDGEKSSLESRDKSREELNRYVYLLFKDKKGSGQFPTANTTMDRLAREERDKLSKAVILWNPPMKLLNTDEEHESDDEDFKYKDHTDFLKKPGKPSEDSVIITEIQEISTDPMQASNPSVEDDDIMAD